MVAAKYKIIRKCKICGEEFLAKTLESWYCSKRCMNLASKAKRREREYQQKLDELAKRIPKSKDMITVAEAHALFGISTKTIHRLIQRGVFIGKNLGIRQTFVSKQELMKLYPLRPKATEPVKPLAKLYRMEPEDCYTVGDVAKKYRMDDSTVYLHIRKYSIPTRQIGNFVYVPKKEIDDLYKDIKL